MPGAIQAVARANTLHGLEQQPPAAHQLRFGIVFSLKPLITSMASDCSSATSRNMASAADRGTKWPAWPSCRLRTPLAGKCHRNNPADSLLIIDNEGKGVRVFSWRSPPRCPSGLRLGPPAIGIAILFDHRVARLHLSLFLMRTMRLQQLMRHSINVIGARHAAPCRNIHPRR